MQQSHLTPHTPGPANGCLHLVVSADARALDDCLAHLAAEDSVLFLDLGVLQLLRNGPGSLAGGAAAVYFAAVDLRAQNLVELARREQVDILEDAGFCALLQRHRHCLTWT